MKQFISINALFVLIFCAYSCVEDITPTIPNEEEVITTLVYRLTPQNGGETVEFIFQDLDGDGGNAPTIIAPSLLANTLYSGVVLLKNELYVPPLNITEEVEEEGVDHQFFYETSSNLQIIYEDEDANGNPVGLMTNLQTQEAGSATITIILRHEPDKFASGVNLGEIAEAGGETDIQVNFECNVE